MPIGINANLIGAAGRGRSFIGGGPIGLAGAGIGGAGTAPPAPAQPPAQPDAPPAPLSVAGSLSTLDLASVAVAGLPSHTFVRPDILPFFPPAQKTATELARGAIAQLKAAEPAAITEALNAIRSRGLDGEGVMNYLQRKVDIRTVLNELARDWPDATKGDFADAFQMGRDRLAAMDSIVSIAILNDRDLEAELRIENTPQTSPGDLTDNRRIVWQSVPAGTPLTPPYVILVAVEYREVAKAEEVIQSLLGELGSFQGFKLPKAAIPRL